MHDMRTQTYHAVQLLVAERNRQMDGEGWSLRHDDDHAEGELARAAGVYAIFSALIPASWVQPLLAFWPWAPEWLKTGEPTDRQRCLVKAGALIIAELERLERAARP